MSDVWPLQHIFGPADSILSPFDEITSTLDKDKLQQLVSTSVLRCSPRSAG
ncbi:hypothetical protein L227DRAFT_657455 [Lentinus tigrinus ALCF2SS1-6]|uniref:Uncharacterized protein n=1 Tax=Lentinus tigrinus ALCF2SS1-6 TaxID=1328759 RepID=A0A5C2RVM6_9APHY|nr:hypothetical protein L227DRAFT_657455 [Lentinus tigrinus ALCF2SS1-6]